MIKKRVLLGAAYSSIEPLGLLHLGGLARNLGCERKFYLVKNHDFQPFFDMVKDYRPDIVGFTVYTGNHIQLHEAFKKLKRDFPNIQTAVGGYHPTYFPLESINHADFVVMSEGFKAFRDIINENAEKGIIPLKELEKFPLPDRVAFYKDYPEHGKSKIKSMITGTGCPYGCTYCYNSSTLEDLKISPKTAEHFVRQGMGERLFPQNTRDLEDILKEGREIAENWPTEMIYFQDDVFGFDDKVGGFLDQLSETWPSQVDIPFHAQMRWEMTKSDKRLDYIRSAGGFGLTLAIEAADPDMRKNILDRHMNDELVFEGMEKLMDKGFKVRTEQITGLPWGVTPNITSMNLDADLEMLEYNVRLIRMTGGPTMAWASTLVPYLGTKIYNTCEEFGFYFSDNSDIQDTFFERSVLRFLKEWLGPKRAKKFKDNQEVWLSQDELERYRDQNAELRRIFNFVSLVPEGHKLARSYLESSLPFSFERIGQETKKFLENRSDQESVKIMGKIRNLHNYFNGLENCEIKKEIINLIPYFAVLPKSELAIERVINYSVKKKETKLDTITLSTAIRHHLYDEVLYYTGNKSNTSFKFNEQVNPRQSDNKV